MTRIGLDDVLLYLATGDDESPVLDGLPDQDDAQAVLAQAQAALELLSPAGVGDAVAARLARLARLLGPGGLPAPPAASARSRAAPSASRAPSARFKHEARSLPARDLLDVPLSSRRAMRTSASDSRLERRGEPDVPPGLGVAIRQGAAEALRAGTAVLHKPFVKAVAPARLRRPPPPGSTAFDPGDIDMAWSPVVAAHRLSEPGLFDDAPSPPTVGDAESRYAADHAAPGRAPGPPAARSAARFPLGPHGSAELCWEPTDDGDRLRVTLQGDHAGLRPLLVTCIPAEGPVTRATTDATGTVLLPWPAQGQGLLRVDGDRTVEIALRVEL